METRAPTGAPTYFFYFAMRVGWRLRRYKLLVAACRLWGNNAPAALHRVGGRQGRLRRLHIFLFCHAGGLAPSALHVVSEHDGVVYGDCGCGELHADGRQGVCRAEGALSFPWQAPCLCANENGRRGGRPFGVRHRLFSCGAWAFWRVRAREPGGVPGARCCIARCFSASIPSRG